MTEENVLRAICVKCNKEFFPFGVIPQIVPYTGFIRCYHCGATFEGTWLDSKGRAELARKNVGLPTDSTPITNIHEELATQTKKINELTEEKEHLKKQLEEEKEKRLTLENNIEELMEKLKGIEKYSNILDWIENYVKNASRTGRDPLA